MADQMQQKMEENPHFIDIILAEFQTEMKFTGKCIYCVVITRSVCCKSQHKARRRVEYISSGYGLIRHQNISVVMSWSGYY